MDVLATLFYPLKDLPTQPGVKVPVLRRQRQVNLCEFEASLIYMVKGEGGRGGGGRKKERDREIERVLYFRPSHTAKSLPCP